MPLALTGSGLEHTPHSDRSDNMMAVRGAQQIFMPELCALSRQALRSLWAKTLCSSFSFMTRVRNLNLRRVFHAGSNCAHMGAPGLFMAAEKILPATD